MYVDDIAQEIRALLSEEQIPPHSDDLFRTYAVLVLALGVAVTDADVHAAWSAWMVRREADHEALVPYDELPDDVQLMDRPYRDAIRKVASQRRGLGGALFRKGPPEPEDRADILKLYEMMVDSSEALVGRRQGVNTFFLTLNGALLTAIGLMLRSGGDSSIVGYGVLAIAVAGALFGYAWHSLIRSFGQLNAGKFAVIHELEKYLPARIYFAEWEALERGENPDVYRSFTSREIWVPKIAIAIFSVAVVAGLFAGLGWWKP